MESIIVSLPKEEKPLVKKKKEKKRYVKASRQLGITSSRKVELEKKRNFFLSFFYSSKNTKYPPVFLTYNYNSWNPSTKVIAHKAMQ